MSKVPDMINKVVDKFKDGGKNGSIVEKGLTNANKLTKSELGQFVETVGTTTDENGKIVIDSGEGSIFKEMWEDSSMKDELQAIYGDYETFIEAY
jgi:hypothetical protein